jgi:hypothetical protein
MNVLKEGAAGKVYQISVIGRVIFINALVGLVDGSF